eukprot:gene2158-2476_t
MAENRQIADKEKQRQARRLLSGAKRAAQQEQIREAAQPRRRNTSADVLDDVLETAARSPPGSPVRQVVDQTMGKFSSVPLAMAALPGAQLGDATVAAVLGEIRSGMQAMQDSWKADIAALQARQQIQGLAAPDLRDKALKVVGQQAAATLKNNPDAVDKERQQMVIKAVTVLDKLEYAGFAWEKLDLVFPTVDLLLAEADMPEAVLSERILGHGLAQGLIKPKLNGAGMANAMVGVLMPMATDGMALGGMAMPTAQQHTYSMAQQQVMLQQLAAILAGQLGGAQLGPGVAGNLAPGSWLLAPGLGMGLQGQTVGLTVAWHSVC